MSRRLEDEIARAQRVGGDEPELDSAGIAVSVRRVDGAGVEGALHRGRSSAVGPQPERLCASAKVRGIEGADIDLVAIARREVGNEITAVVVGQELEGVVTIASGKAIGTPATASARSFLR